MTILEFIKEQYPVQNRIRDRLIDPYKAIELRDDLPYDVIAPDDSGVLTKMVEVETGVYYPIMDFISWNDAYAKAYCDPQTYEVWKAYMSQLIILDINVDDIKRSIKAYTAGSEKRKEQLNVLSLQKEQEGKPSDL